MKYLYIIFLIGVFSFCPILKAQTEKTDIRKIIVPTERATFPGGDKEMMKFLYSNLIYPDICVSGKVILSFYVETDGTLSDIKVLRSLDPLFDAEVIRVVKMMPKWNPAIYNGSPVAFTYILPVNFAAPDYESVPQDSVYMGVEEMPDFPGGTSELMTFLTSNIKFPVTGAHHELSGRTIIRFVVEKDGTLSNYQIIKSINPDFDREVIRVMELMPRWKPGKNNGIPARTYYTIPITIHLQD